jgi:hypothetical protein
MYFLVSDPAMRASFLMRDCITRARLGRWRRFLKLAAGLLVYNGAWAARAAWRLAMSKKPPTYAERAQASMEAKEMLGRRLARAKEAGLAPGWACCTTPGVGSVAREAEALIKAGKAGSPKMAALAGQFARALSASASDKFLHTDSAMACARLAKAFGGADLGPQRAAWVSRARWVDKQGADQAGLHAHWLAQALLDDDAAELASLLGAGAQPWGLAASGWHPLDWAWLLDAKACAPLMARVVMPWEVAAKKGPEQPWSSGGSPVGMMMIFDDFWSSLRGVSFGMPTLTGLRRERQEGGMGLFSRACRAAMMSNRAPRQEDAFRLLSLARAGAPKARRRREPLEEGEALELWSQALPPGKARAWVESVELRACAAPVQEEQSQSARARL